MADAERLPITEDWLKSVGFKWSQFDRQPTKHWLLWLGHAIDCSISCYEDLGIEIASGGHIFRKGKPTEDAWHCWLRGDSAGRYHRFIHVRAIQFQDEVAALVAALTGQEWNPENHLYGIAHTPEQATALRVEHDRIDKRLAREGRPWYEAEKDETRAGPLIEHVEAAMKSGLAK